MYLNLCGISPKLLLKMQEGTRLKGSLGLSADGTLNFNPWRTTPPEPHAFQRLRHGRVSVGERHIRLKIDLDRREKLDNPVDSLFSDTYDAMNFVRKEIESQDLLNDGQQAG